MKLLSLNVALFEENNEKLFKFLKEQKPDILCLQEVAYSNDPNVNPAYLTKNFTSLVDEYNVSTTRPKTNELSHLERNVVDYILASKGVKVRSFEIVRSDISDHLPLVLDFEI